jgi:hypothetical protein
MHARKSSSHPHPPIQLKTGRYKHYKGKHYEVIGVAKHSETEEALVVYRSLCGESNLWVRPLAMFNEQVELNGEQVPRFTAIEDHAVDYQAADQ